MPSNNISLFLKVGPDKIWLLLFSPLLLMPLAFMFADQKLSLIFGLSLSFVRDYGWYYILFKAIKGKGGRFHKPLFIPVFLFLFAITTFIFAPITILPIWVLVHQLLFILASFLLTTALLKLEGRYRFWRSAGLALMVCYLLVAPWVFYPRLKNL
jgi:hypothetical protein